MAPPIRRYRHFNQSEGELCNLPEKLNDVPHNAVGTYNCQTTLCLYVEFEDDSVFIAHMIAHNETAIGSAQSGLPGEPPINTDWYGQWTSLPHQGKALQAFVLKHLELQPWADKRKQATRGFLVCPAISGTKQANGWWMSQAIKEFFAPLEIEVLTHVHGFAAGPGGLPTVLFEFDAGRKPIKPEMHGWRSCDQKEEEDGSTEMSGNWAFTCTDGVWSMRWPKYEKIDWSVPGSIDESVSDSMDAD